MANAEPHSGIDYSRSASSADYGVLELSAVHWQLSIMDEHSAIHISPSRD